MFSTTVAIALALCVILLLGLVAKGSLHTSSNDREGTYVF